MGNGLATPDRRLPAQGRPRHQGEDRHRRPRLRQRRRRQPHSSSRQRHPAANNVLGQQQPPAPDRAETDGSQVAGYTYNPLGQIQTSQQGTGAFYYHHDQLGSVTDLTDAAGTNQYRYTYDAFGSLTTDKLTTSPPANPFTYTGQYKEPTTETLGYNLRARNYAPDQGRFTSRDPETQSPLDP
ncbi:RHS repeat-associated core domain-containing protein [Streptomyces sp. NPDC051994]|uniref:RHS repeat-associated core domain-containing protein n=1 Tax=unclassified Streptomyces TaxID=2593676 RepID=UPI003446E811